jgi:hypothetical protein
MFVEIQRIARTMAIAAKQDCVMTTTSQVIVEFVAQDYE